MELGLELFASRSYDEVSIDELAAVAGISKGLLYHYFPTKKDFYAATVRASAQQLLDQTGKAADGEPLTRLRVGLDAYLDYVEAHVPSYTSLLRSGVGADPEVARIVDETRAVLVGRLAEGMTEGGPLVRLALRGWLGFVEATTLDWLDGKRKVPRDALRDLCAQALLRAVDVAAGR